MMTQRLEIPVEILSVKVFEELKDTFSNSHEFENLVRRFFDVTTADLQEIKAAFLRGEWKSLARIAHRMISSAHPFGAHQACALLKTVEQLALNEETQSLREHIKRLDDCLLKTKNLVEEQMHTNLGAVDRTKGQL